MRLVQLGCAGSYLRALVHHCNIELNLIDVIMVT
jgi:hypothetical protein